MQITAAPCLRLDYMSQTRSAEQPAGVPEQDLPSSGGAAAGLAHRQIT